MRSGLYTLQKLRKKELDDKRRVLASVNAQINSAEERLKNLDKQQAQQEEFVLAHPEYRLTWQSFLESIHKNRTQLGDYKEQLEIYRRQVEASVREAFMEFKSIESYVKAKINEQRLKAEKIEQISMDEIAQNKWHREKYY